MRRELGAVVAVPRVDDAGRLAMLELILEVVHEHLERAAPTRRPCLGGSR